jgi:hypothetical protein
LVVKRTKINKKGFQVTDFNSFILKAKEKQDISQKVAAELEKLKTNSATDYNVEIFEGEEGLKSYFSYLESLLRKGKLENYLVLGSTSFSISKIKFFLLSRMKDVRPLARNIDFRIIWSAKAKSNIFLKSLSAISKQKFLPENVKTECTTIVFNDYIALMFNTDKPVVVRIQNKSIADTYKNQFELIWSITE